ncbi:MAG: AtpZ/AtpI family protein [Flavobacteriales bacterium]
MGFKMAVVIFGGIYGGFRLDHWIGWKFPVFTLLFALASLSLAIYIMIRDLQK